jgi:hypothetical protein
MDRKWTRLGLAATKQCFLIDFKADWLREQFFSKNYFISCIKTGSNPCGSA